VDPVPYTMAEPSALTRLTLSAYLPPETLVSMTEAVAVEVAINFLATERASITISATLPEPDPFWSVHSRVGWTVLYLCELVKFGDPYASCSETSPVTVLSVCLKN